MYKIDLRIRFSDSYQTGRISIHTILELFQDVGFFHSEDLGYGLKGELDAKQAWYLLAWHIEIHRLPAVNEYVTVTTEPYQMKGYFAYRRYQILDQEGNCCVLGDARWVHMNLTNMLPIRSSEELCRAYIPVPLDYKPMVKRKLKDQGEWQFQKECNIPAWMIDTNAHLNNTNYLIFVEEFLGDNDKISQINIEYRQAAKKDDIISVYTCQEKDTHRIMLRLPGDEVSCIIEYFKK